MAVFHHHQPGHRAEPSLAALVAFVVGFVLALPLGAVFAVAVLPPMLPLGAQVVSRPVAAAMTVMIAGTTGLGAAVCAAARAARR